MLRGFISGTCNLLSEVLDDRVVHPVIHRDTSWDTLGVHTWILLILAVCLGFLWESFFRPSGDKFVILDAQMAFRIKIKFSIGFVRRNDLLWEPVCAKSILNTMVCIRCDVHRKIKSLVSWDSFLKESWEIFGVLAGPFCGL